ncbi:hypothetical protein Q31a_07940 [Aureliella helgolandensis]|uniref:Uncharacterized protein n=1 Tax=Aureliella helgolandensis TaxID=2527968 RepID=A0A518G1M7_9BACT|nr:hypothetical protein Q31a_07940 [Aureliella helgolandensis]
MLNRSPILGQFVHHEFVELTLVRLVWYAEALSRLPASTLCTVRLLSDELSWPTGHAGRRKTTSIPDLQPRCLQVTKGVRDARAVPLYAS